MKEEDIMKKLDEHMQARIHADFEYLMSEGNTEEEAAAIIKEHWKLENLTVKHTT